MFNIFFYIFLAMILTAGLINVFSGRVINSSISFVVLMASIFGLFVLLNAELFAFLGLLALSIMFAMTLIFSKRGFVQEIAEDVNDTYPKGKQFAAVIVLSVLGGITASLVSSTNWQIISVNYAINSLGLIFSKYLIVIILISLLLSAILASLKYVLRKEMPTE
ncbi:MAG: hypothetical protein IT281_05970 [Ignavibacteria bacterium]|nr:hypothetical protein [Ignavibacteria bacterium]